MGAPVAEKVVVVEEVIMGSDKKTRRRSNRRGNKQNLSSASGVCYIDTTKRSESGCSSDYLSVSSNSLSSQSTVVSTDLTLCGAYSVAFSSLPTMHIYSEATSYGGQQVPFSFLSVSAQALHSNSCPVPIGPLPTNGSLEMKVNASYVGTGFCVNRQRRYFMPHWPVETVSKALEEGEIFTASFRVNAYNKLEAYCTIDGVSTDVLINGTSQNRAVEGDIVAIKLDPFKMWTRLKGSTVTAVPMHDSTLPKVSEPDVVNKDPSSSLEKICSLVKSFPLKRPTGKVVAIVKSSSRRNSILGFLDVKDELSYKEGHQKEFMKNRSWISGTNKDFIELIPNDAKLPKMLVPVRNLPDHIKKRLEVGDQTVAMELVGARIDQWNEENPVPLAYIFHVFGRGGDIQAQADSILFETGIRSSEFPPDVLSCLPHFSWEVPREELRRRKDLRNLCTLTIDPATATDLDDALSVERVSNDVFRVGVHIADASFFILPDTALDMEARTRSTSVYLRQHKVPMLPPLLSHNLGSLKPGVDRLAMSMVFDLNRAGEVLDRWIGRTVIRSCCQLSYRHCQDIIEYGEATDSSTFPIVHGSFERNDVIDSIRGLHEISKILKQSRTKNGAFSLESSKLLLLFDECGVPYDSMFHTQTESDYLIEEFMLLANRTAAEVISRAFPDSALLRRHPEPKIRKLLELESFCFKHGLELDTSSSAQFHLSLEKIRENLVNDPVLFDIVLSYASKPMQLASYFCTGDFRDKESEWAHYSLAIPFYTHFTSPLRRYPDVVVHRSLAAVIDAENIYRQHNGNFAAARCFTGLQFQKDIAESKGFKDGLSATTLKYGVPCMETATDIAAYSNERRMASRRAENASSKLYLWVLLKKKQTLITEARVLGLGPKFMSIYIPKLAMERRIQYGEVQDLKVEWLELTSTLVLDLLEDKCCPMTASTSESLQLENVALVVNPCDLKMKDSESVDILGISDIGQVDPVFFPLTVQILSTISVALYAIGGDDGPLDIGVKLYMSSYEVNSDI